MLAIITIIAVPKILNVIEKSKESSAESSIKLVKDAIKTQIVSGDALNESNFIKNNDGCYLFNFDDQSTGNSKELKLKNKDKISGSITYCNGAFRDDTLKFNGTEISKDDNNNKIICKRATTLHTEECTQTDATYYCSGAGYTTSGSKGTSTITYGNLGTTGTLSSGDAFDCDINGDGIYNSETERFYYISDYYNTSTKSFESDTSVLIYYNNTTKGTPDNSANSKSAYGTLANPSSAITNLPKWSNVKLKNSARHILDQLDETKTTTPFNYSGYTTRLATTQEINKACYLSFNWVKGELDNCNFLMENTGFSSSSMGTNGYWLETPRQLWDDRAFVVYSVNRDVEGSVIANAGYGVRPVIEVLKTQISY